MKTTITFLGTADALPGAGREGTSFLIDDGLLIDCGWYCAVRLQECGSHPLTVQTVFFTHCHPDHYGGLPGLLWWRGLGGRQVADLRPLHLVGPAEDLALVANLCHRFLQAERFKSTWPEITTEALEPGETWETDRYRVETIRARHPVPAFSSRLTAKESGAVIAFSGDTGPNEAVVELARGADLLIHEATLAPEISDAEMKGDHSRAIDAARIARAAGVKQLRLVHVQAHHAQASEEAASTIFPGGALAREGETMFLPNPSPRPPNP